MKRFAKTYAQPLTPDLALPKSNKFTMDLMGLQLNEDQLAEVRSEAVKAAMIAASGLLKSRVNPFADFGTFSTFSTFSTFGSAAAEIRPEVVLPHDLPTDARLAIERTLGGKSRSIKTE